MIIKRILEVGTWTKLSSLFDNHQYLLFSYISFCDTQRVFLSDPRALSLSNSLTFLLFFFVYLFICPFVCKSFLFVHILYFSALQHINIKQNLWQYSNCFYINIVSHQWMPSNSLIFEWKFCVPSVYVFWNEWYQNPFWISQNLSVEIFWMWTFWMCTLKLLKSNEA